MTNPAIFQFLLQCACPLGAAISDPTAPTCLEDIGEIRAFAIQRTRNGTALNEIVIATDDPTLKATWTDLQAAADSTKVAFLADIAQITVSGGEPRDVGEGQGGAQIRKGSTPQVWTAQFQQIQQDVIRSYESYQCEPELSIFLINEFGQFIGLKDADVATTFRGIPLKNFWVGDKMPGFYAGYDYNGVSWTFLSGWSRYLHVIQPAFDPLVEL